MRSATSYDTKLTPHKPSLSFCAWLCHQSAQNCEPERSRHWDAEYQLIRSEVGQRESVKIQWMETGRHCSDALTKGLTRSLFEKHTQRLMGEPWIFPDDSTADE